MLTDEGSEVQGHTCQEGAGPGARITAQAHNCSAVTTAHLEIVEARSSISEMTYQGSEVGSGEWQA